MTTSQETTQAHATPASTVPRHTERTPIAPPAPVTTPSTGMMKTITRQPRITRTTAYLQDNDKTGSTRAKHKGYRRMVLLNLQEMYDALITLYTTAFIAQWRNLKPGVEVSLPNPAPAGSAAKYAASVYISHWIVDLYVSIRDAVREISHPAYGQHFSYDFAHYSTVYDAFLVSLNAMIRPTLIEGSAEESMYIPYFGNGLFTDRSNPFNLTNFHINYDCFNFIIHQMEDKKEWITETLMSNTTGRAAWLLDWSDTDAFAWFQQESNYSDDDITLAYIVGTALTPPLAPRDKDDWQYFPGGTRPTPINVTDYTRLSVRSMYGAFEVRRMSTRQVDPAIFMTAEDAEEAPSTKRKRLDDAAKEKQPSKSSLVIKEPGTEGKDAEEEMDVSEPTYKDKALALSTSSAKPKKLWQFRLSDYIYFRRVIYNCDQHTRSAALKMLIHESRN